MIKNPNNNIFEYFFENRENNKYQINKSDDNIKIYNDKISILIYYLKDYIINSDELDIEDAINNIKENIGSHAYCNNNKDIIFWSNLTKCIIVYPNNLEIYLNTLKNKETDLIIYVKEDYFNNILDYYFN